MSEAKEFKNLLKNTQEQIVAINNLDPWEAHEKSFSPPPPYPNYAFSQPTIQAFDWFHRLTYADIYRFHNEMPEPRKPLVTLNNDVTQAKAATEKTIARSAATTQTQPQNQPEIIDGQSQTHPQTYPQTAQAITSQLDENGQPISNSTDENRGGIASSSTASIPATTTVKQVAPADRFIFPNLPVYADNYLKSFSFEYLDNSDIPHLNELGEKPSPKINSTENLSQAELNICNITRKELDFFSSQVGAQGYSSIAFIKLKKILSAMENRRFKDALTLIQISCKDNPNNRTIAFVSSQLHFFLAQQEGFTEGLPEAHSQAKKSCIFTEDFDSAKLLYYRYSHAVLEFAHSHDNCLECIRNYHLLSPELLISPEGLAFHKGFHLKSWILLSHIPLEKWQEFEIESLEEVSNTVVSGALLYLYFFHDNIVQKLEESNKNFGAFEFVENNISKSNHIYQTISRTLEQEFTNKGILRGLSNNSWLLPAKHTQIFLTAAPAPSFEDIYLNISMDIHRFETENYPNEQIQNKGLESCNFWRTWGMSITPFDENRNPFLFPIMDLKEKVELLTNFDNILKNLEKYEKELVNHDKWEDLKPFLAPYNFASLIEVGSGNKSRLFKAPKEEYFAPYFKKWRRGLADSYLPSNIIKAYGNAGGFIEMMEIQAAFEGALTILDDPIHGLKARVKAAFKYYKKIKKVQKQVNKDVQAEKALEHFKDLWWVYFIVVPVGIFVLSLSLFSGSFEDASQVLLIIFALLIGGGIALHSINQSKKSADKKDKKP